MPYEQLLKHRQRNTDATYQLCFCTRHRSRLLRNASAAAIVVSAIEEQEAAGNSINHAWVVMPDHVHWLLSVSGFHSVAQVVGGCKANSTRRLKNAGLAAASPWQVGYYEHRLRNDQDLMAQARYLVANPLRAGLVTRLADYPWWFAQWASPPHRPEVLPTSGEDLLW